LSRQPLRRHLPQSPATRHHRGALTGGKKAGRWRYSAYGILKQNFGVVEQVKVHGEPLTQCFCVL
jgi:hypothetical protein